MAIFLNYDSGCNSIPIERIDLCEIIERNSEILFVGEGDFTFTLAFAAWRQSRKKTGGSIWEGISSTHFERQALPVLSTLKFKCIDNIRSYGRTTGADHKDPRCAIERIKDLPEIRFDVDARDIPQSLIPPAGGVIWFQCPWDGKDTTGELVEDFLVNTSKLLRRGTYVCIGITKHYPYIKSYKLADILGDHLRSEDNSTSVLKSYRFLGADVDLIQDILKFGYRHQSIHGDKDIHEQIIHDHVTLVFEKKALRKKAK